MAETLDIELLELSAESEAIAGILDELDYFQILKLPNTAGLADVKTSYYQESRRFHPDRIFHLEDAALKARVLRIYKRITEAYSVLRDDVRRDKYLADITGPSRAEKLRYDEESEQELKRAKDEEIGATPNGRKLFAAGLAALQAGQVDAAERSFKMALLYEPSNERLKAKIDEARERAAGPKA